MKKSKLTLAALAALAVLPGISNAQSNVTITGALLLGPRYVTHANPAGHSRRELTGTQDGLGYLAFRVSEDLGDGLRVNAVLDSAVQPDTGAAGVSGVLYRQSTVGIEGKLGSVTLGRQTWFSGAAGPIVLADPLYGNSANLETTWAGMYTGLRYNNSIQYRGVFNGLMLGAAYAPGEQKANSLGESKALSVGYQQAGTLIRAAVQRSNDGTGKSADIATIGGYFAVSPRWSLHAAYVNGKYEKGFAAAGPAAPTGALFGTSLGLGLPLAADMKSTGGALGVTFRATPQWTFKAALHTMTSTGATFLGPLGAGDGKQQVVYLFGDYALSKRTSLQAGVDHNRWSGKWGGFFGSSVEAGTGAALNGANTRTTVTMGIKHLF